MADAPSRAEVQTPAEALEGARNARRIEAEAGMPPRRRRGAAWVHALAERVLRHKAGRRRAWEREHGARVAATLSARSVVGPATSLDLEALAGRVARRRALAGDDPFLKREAAERNAKDQAAVAGDFGHRPTKEDLSIHPNPPRFGLNGLHVGEQDRSGNALDTTYGAATQLLDDAVLLGAEYVRQYGFWDLLDASGRSLLLGATGALTVILLSTAEIAWR